MAESPLIDIRPDQWEIVRDILHKHVSDREVWAFGSRARWTAKQYSDLDLAVLGNEALDLETLAGLEEDFSESDLPFKVDVVDWATTSEAFRGIIEQGRVLVQEKESKSPIPHPTEWPIVRLGDITSKIGSGATPTGGNGAYLGTRTRFALIRSQNVFDRYFNPTGLAFISDEQAERLRGVILHPGDLLLNITGDGITFSRACAVPHTVLPACVNQHVAIVRVDNSVADPGYVLGYLTHPSVKSYIESFNAGGSRRAITKSNIESFHLPLPPLPEQRAIAQVLGALDDKLELNRRMNADLEAMARALFKDWFVDFGPVRAKVEGRPAYLTPDIWDLFPDALDDEDKPVGWKNGKLGDYFEAIKGVSYKGSGLSDAGMPLHNLNSIHEGGGYKYGGIKHYTGDHGEQHIVKPGDVIVANTEQGHYRLLIGFAAMVPSLFGHQGIISHHIYRLRPKESSPLTAAYLLHLLNSPEMHETVSGYANGTTVNMLPLAGVQQPQCIAPPQALVAVFDSIATSFALRREKNETESRDLATTRDLLLPKLITGEIRVRDAEMAVEVII
ncbi:MAG: restriction endonuclease subunit S [Magnetococcales bacterium]|nr:restriction endonuclease subunit S [Magnetococcales bacterium]